MAERGSGPAAPRRAARRTLSASIGRGLVFLLFALLLLYAGDWIFLRIRIMTNGQPYSTVTVRPYYAVPEKGRKTEFLFDDPHEQTCVHSLFPHDGDTPCWYLTRHTETRISM